MIDFDALVKILIVDDEASIRRSFADYLEDQGFETLTAENGHLGLEVLVREQPHIALVDLRMPEMNGLEFMEQANRLVSGLPVIVISGANRIEEVVKAQKLGSWDYLMKPVKNLSMLGHAVNGVLEKARLRQENQAYQENLETLVRARTAELEQVNASLVASEERYRTLFERSSDAIFLIDVQTGYYINANLAAEQLTGYPVSEIKAKTVTMLSPKGAAERLDLLTTLDATKEFGEVTFVRADGTERVATLTVFPLQERKLVVGIAHDVTERKQAEDELRESEARLKEAQHIAQLGNWRWNLQNNHLYWSDEMYAIYGLEKSAGPSTEKMRQLMVPEDRLRFDAVLQKMTTGEIFESIEYRIQKADGQIRHLLVRTTASVDESGSLIELSGTLQDMTEHKKAELRYRTVADFTFDWEVWENPDKSLNYVSPACEEISGYSAAQFLATPKLFDELIFDEDKALWEAHNHESTIQIQPRREIQFRIKRQDGGIVWIEHACRPVMDEHGTFLGYRASNRDVTMRARANEEVKKLSTAMRQSPVSVVITDPSGNIEYVNPKFTQVTGYSAEEVLGETPRILQGGETSQEEYTHLWQTILSGKEWQGVFRNKKKDGEYYWEETSISAVYSDDGNITHFIALKEDITERKRGEAAIQRYVRRLDALHQIDQAITASFDLNIALNVLLGHLQTHLNVDAAAVLQYQAVLQTLRFSQGRGFRTPALQHMSLRLGQGYAGKVALHRKYLFIPDLNQNESSLSESFHFSEEGFVSYYGTPLIAKGKLVGVLEIFHRSPLVLDDEWTDFLATLANQAAIAIDSAAMFNDLQRSNVELALAYDATIEGWARALELRDMETEGHSRRVVAMSIELARQMGLGGQELADIRRGALLHDIGKMGVPDSILQKPGPLNEEEWEIMRKHPVYAYKWLSPIEYLRLALDIPYCHHEKWDGTGYPRGLQQEQIPLSARIFAVIDVWDALRSDRPYRKAWPDDKIYAYIKDKAGLHFAPRVVDVFMQHNVEA